MSNFLEILKLSKILFHFEFSSKFTELEDLLNDDKQKSLAKQCNDFFFKLKKEITSCVANCDNLFTAPLETFKQFKLLLVDNKVEFFCDKTEFLYDIVKKISETKLTKKFVLNNNSAVHSNKIKIDLKSKRDKPYLNLPEELLLKIFSPFEKDTTNLLKFSLVNYKWLRLVRHMVYDTSVLLPWTFVPFMITLNSNLNFIKCVNKSWPKIIVSKLYFDICWNSVETELLSSLFLQLTTLTELHSPLSFDSIAKVMTRCPLLSTISVGYSGFSDFTFDWTCDSEYLNNLTQIKNLKFYEFFSIKEIDKESLKTLAFKDLETLRFETEGECYWILKFLLNGTVKLRELVICPKNYAEQPLDIYEVLKETKQPNLMYLELKGCNVDSKTLELIKSKFLILNTLKIGDFSQLDLKNRDFDFLKQLLKGGNKHLKGIFLNLDGELTDKILREVSENLPNLVNFNVKFNSGSTNLNFKAVEEFCSSLPKLKFIRNSYFSDDILQLFKNFYVYVEDTPLYNGDFEDEISCYGNEIGLFD
ncbi:hypothetical protein HDU92_004890 [Lobulomyces angularis]|nr:hypothetical protein HDU92_004890 [Lobulomyces angularis]